MNDYYPFGGRFNSYARSFSQPNKYLYQGKEEQEELSTYDSEWRMYDQWLGRTWQHDPHSESYYHLSPYSWVANSPIVMVDPDGRDYGVYIDHESQTVTIRATYYTLGSDTESAQQAAAFWNDQAGSYTYTVGSGEDAVEYGVSFDISVQEVTVDAGEDAFAKLNSVFEADKTGEANIYQVRGDANFEANKNGTTQKGNRVYVRNTRRDSDTGAHEVGHTLGLTHSTRGIMTPSSTSNNRYGGITNGNVQQMLRYPLRGKQNSSAGIGVVHEDYQLIKDFYDDYYKHHQNPTYIDVRPRNSKGKVLKMKGGKVK